MAQLQKKPVYQTVLSKPPCILVSTKFTSSEVQRLADSSHPRFEFSLRVFDLDKVREKPASPTFVEN